ncbi:hypothetical protein H4R20_001084 [Coemansia guatemalensis]|uniref:Protein kinase domain-containing protein n=1 Tax=Coemansia guatemalensis TaxID=2761395 RepID=A0A9W8I515_9FUNG|nr:hypothetical protein H4R20_001084 [Coemansia guatemalensis]
MTSNSLSSSDDSNKRAVQPSPSPREESGNYLILQLLETLVKGQAERDKEQAKRDKEQAERDEEFRQWRKDQAERDREFRQWQKDQIGRDEEFRQWQKEQSDVLKQLLDINLRKVDAAPATAELRTPTRHHREQYSVSVSQHHQSQTASGAATHLSTPQKSIPAPSKFDETEYVNLSKLYSTFSYNSSLPDALDLLGSGWRDSWKSFRCKGSVDKILEEYCNKCEKIRGELAAKNVLEDVYQRAFGYLVEAIQHQAGEILKPAPVLYWCDTHSKSIKRGDGRSRKPDGIFSTSDSERLQWQDIAAVVEIKGERMDNDNDHIRGQLLQNFIDMAEVMPRRFMLGLTIANKGVVKVHVCVPGGIYNAPLGRLHLTGASKPKASKANTRLCTLKATDEERRVVAFLLFLYKQSREDCGYLTGRNFEFPGRLSLAKIHGASPADENMLSRKTTLTFIYSLGDKDKVYGRHKHLKGQRTWAYPVTYTDKYNKKANAFFKFQWGLDGEEEIDVHRFVLKRGVPHIPKLLYAVTMDGGSRGTSGQKYKGEAIVTEDVGETIRNLFADGRLVASEAQIIDIFAGYTHTLIAAAAFDDNERFALHRDISMGNLMVKDKAHPYIIDWGCGRVCSFNEKRISSGNELIGTAIYMSLRVLENCGTRSVIDDLESLFLVLCHCLWSSYGKKDDYYKSLWSGRDEFSTKTARGYWLSSKENFIDRMQLLDRRPKALLALIEGMYELLFSGYTITDICAKKPVENVPAPDPRVEKFDPAKWNEIFQLAIGRADTKQIKLSCLDNLSKYVSKDESRRISFISVVSPPPLDTVGAASSLPSSNSGIKGQKRTTSQQEHLSSPTKSGSKRQSDYASSFASSKKSRN